MSNHDNRFPFSIKLMKNMLLFTARKRELFAGAIYPAPTITAPEQDFQF